jgi:hydrogenase nickel incorporation protein HypA/HybF
MHEWALAESILTAAVEASKKEKMEKITEIKIALGELQQIEKDIFKFALDEIIKEHGGILKNAKIIIKTEKSTLKCKNCEKTWSFSDMKKKLDEDESESIHFIPEVAFVHTRCPKCGSPDFEITAGRGVSITQIKGEK